MNPSPPLSAPITRRNDIAEVIRDANVSFPDAIMNEESLIEATRTFVAGLVENQIPHVLVGGLAVLQHIEGRNTRDIDLIIAVKDIDRLPGFTLREQNEWFASGQVGALRVDLLLTANPLFQEISERHVEERDFVGTRLTCATPEGIILLKLFALPSLYRQGQLDRVALYETDVLMLLRHYPCEDSLLESQLAPHIPESDLNALRDVLAEIRERLNKTSRFQN